MNQNKTAMDLMIEHLERKRDYLTKAIPGHSEKDTEILIHIRDFISDLKQQAESLRATTEREQIEAAVKHERLFDANDMANQYYTEQYGGK